VTQSKREHVTAEYPESKVAFRQAMVGARELCYEVDKRLDNAEIKDADGMVQRAATLWLTGHEVYCRLLAGRSESGPYLNHLQSAYQLLLRTHSRVYRAFPDQQTRGKLDDVRLRLGQAHAQLLEVVAEGAESDSDAVELYQLGCEYAQGFAFGEPMSAEEARALLLGDRVEVARLGGRGFLHKPVPPTQIVDMVLHLQQQLRDTTATVLAIDDDPHILATLQTLLEQQGFKLTTLGDPQKFWDVLTQVAPDLLVLDIDMPHVDGIALCRVIRNAPQWSMLPVLFLTAYTDAATIQKVFAAGADDFVSKPIVGPELLTRITNRLERMQLLQRTEIFQ